jgi:hypothetical protein
MDKRNIFLLIVLIAFCSCNKREQRLNAELKSIANSVKIQTREPSMDLEMFDILFPKRYHEMAILYSDLRKETNILNSLLDSLNNIKTNTLSITEKERFNRLFKLIDSIYIPRLDTVRGGDNYGNNYQYTQLTYLNKYLISLKEKIAYANSRTDLEFAKLYLSLIEREVVDFIHEEALAGTVAITNLRPITIKKGNTLDCYLAAVDTCNYPNILIGKFKHYKISDHQVSFNALEIIDTITFVGEKASINLNEINGYEAIIQLTGPHGEPIQYKVDQ